MRISDWSSDVCSSDLVEIGIIAYLRRQVESAVRRLVKGWPDRILLPGICQQGEQSAAQRAARASAKRQQWIQSGTGGRHRRLIRFPIKPGNNGRQINDLAASCASSTRGAPTLAEHPKRHFLTPDATQAIATDKQALALGH